MRPQKLIFFLHLKKNHWGYQGQDSFIMRELDDAEVGLADVGHNADLLYVVNQESTDLIREAHHMGDAPLRFMGQDVLYFQRAA